MASLTIACGRNHPAIHHHCRLRLGLDRRNSNRNRIAQCHRCRRGPRMSATAATANSPVSALCPLNPGSSNSGALFTENLDEWMRDSAVEIVKNLREAPLLLQVYANKTNNGETARLETEKAIADDWPVVTCRWKDGETPPPDGVILVKELGDEEDGEDLEDESGTRAWGIVIQGKAVECGPACYLMKTSRVGSGLGLCCTHFCLTKIQDFGRSAVAQLTNCWLLERVPI